MNAACGKRWRELDKNLDSYAARRPRETAVVILEPRHAADRNLRTQSASKVDRVARSGSHQGRTAKQNATTCGYPRTPERAPQTQDPRFLARSRCHRRGEAASAPFASFSLYGYPRPLGCRPRASPQPFGAGDSRGDCNDSDSGNPRTSKCVRVRPLPGPGHDDREERDGLLRRPLARRTSPPTQATHRLDP